MSGIALYYIKAGSANGRLIIYLISILNIAHHPILGSGIGIFFHQYADGMAQFSMRHPGFNYQSADVLAVFRSGRRAASRTGGSP